MSNFFKNNLSVGAIVYKYRIWILAALIPLTIGALLCLPDLQFKADFSKFFPEKNSDLKFYEKHAAIFGNRDDFLSIGIGRPDGVLDVDFLQRVQAFSDSCRSLELVNRTYSVLHVSEGRSTPLGLIYNPLIRLSKASISRTDSLKVVSHPLVKHQLLSADGTALLVLLELAEERTTVSARALMDQLHGLLASFSFEETHIIGTVALEINHIQLTSEELFFFVKVCISLLVVLLLFIYRSLVAVLLPLVIFLLSLIYLGALLALLGITLDTMSTMLPTIVLIVSVSDVIHLFAKMRSDGKSDLTGLIHSVDKVARTNFLTSLTTAIGFFTLIISPMPTLMDFGVAVGLGVLLAYVLSILIVPITFYFLPDKIPEPTGIFSKSHWDQRVERRLFPLLHRPKLVFLGLLLLLLLSGLGISNINNNRFLTSTMPYNHEIRRSYQFFETHFQGSREFDISITAKEPGGLLQLENLQLIDRLQSHLDSLPEIGGMLSPVTYFKIGNKVYFAFNQDEYVLPEQQELLDRLHRRVPKNLKYRFRNVLDSTMTYGAIRGHMRDVGMRSHTTLMADIDRWISRQNNDQLEFRHTGIPMLLDKINFLQIEANFVGLLIAAVFISLLIALLFRSWVFILVTLVGNLLPLVLIAGIMGLTDIEMRGSTSLVFSVAFVIIVDDTIHFLSNFLQNRSMGQSTIPAIQNTLRHTGHAILLTTLVLAIVTIALLWSDLPDVRNLGFLLTVALLIALAFDLILIPLVLNMTYINLNS